MTDRLSAIQAQQILQNWFSPAFPIGAFNFSHGLETAIDEDWVRAEADLGDWLEVVLRQGSGWNDAVLLSLTMREQHALSELNDHALALCAGRERYVETCALGKAFTENVMRLHAVRLPEGLAFPIAVAEAARQLGLPHEAVCAAYLQSFVQNLILVAVKHQPLGQSAGQRLLTARFELIAEVAALATRATLDDLGGHGWRADLASLMHEHQHVRIYVT